jgi:hypothetical protein
MSGEASDFGALANRFRQLGAADRRAVLARFSANERQVFERRLAADLDERRRKLAEERRADRQFAAYSLAIGAKVERAVRGKALENRDMTQACAMAVARAHKDTESPSERPALETIFARLGIGSLASAIGERK